MKKPQVRGARHAMACMWACGWRLEHHSTYSVSRHEIQGPSFSSPPLNSSQESKRTETLVELDPSLWIVCWLTRLAETMGEPQPAPKRATSLGTAGPRPPGSHAPNPGVRSMRSLLIFVSPRSSPVCFAVTHKFASPSYQVYN